MSSRTLVSNYKRPWILWEKNEQSKCAAGLKRHHGEDLSSLCLLCEGYSSDGSDYYVRRWRRNSSECSGCGDSICECHDSCDCSDWEDRSDKEEYLECSSPEPKVNNNTDDPQRTSESKRGGRKIASKDGTKDDGPEFVKLKEFQGECGEGAKAKKRPQDAESKSDESDSASDSTAVTSRSCSQSDCSEESDTEKPNDNNKDNNSNSSGEDGYPKEIQEFLQRNEMAESSDNTGVRTRRYANYYDSSRRRYFDRGAGHKYRSRRERRSTRRRHIYSKVMMPNGEFHWITTPAAEKKSSWKCGTNTELIPLRPNGRMGKKEYQLISEQMEGTRRNHISGAYSGYEIIKIQKIVNPCLWKRYRHRRYDIKVELHGGIVKEQMLFHGSPAIKELIQNGFDERYSSTDGMFGAGVYFAENSSKSNQYAWGLNKGCPTHNNQNCMVCERQLLLCRVTLGKVQEYTSAQRLAHAPVGYHSVKGVPTVGGLQYSENIVYRGEQVYPEFLIAYILKP